MHTQTQKIRIVIGKVGCDIHERGALALAQAFKDAGMEVVYLGRYQTPEGVVKTAIEEGADVIALSDHTGSMPFIAESVIEALKKYGRSDIKVIAGGLITKKHVSILEKMGVTGNFGPGTPLNVITSHIETIAGKGLRPYSRKVLD